MHPHELHKIWKTQENKMTNEQINAAIAEVCGWKAVSVDGDSGFYRGFDNGAELRPDLPDYVNDLNAMHEAEKILIQKQRDEYRYWLCSDIFSTARERAEIFLLVQRKREESK